MNLDTEPPSIRRVTFGLPVETGNYSERPSMSRWRILHLALIATQPPRLVTSSVELRLSSLDRASPLGML